MYLVLWSWVREIFTLVVPSPLIGLGRIVTLNFIKNKMRVFVRAHLGLLFKKNKGMLKTQFAQNKNANPVYY